jgi:hypothetical protein
MSDAGMFGDSVYEGGDPVGDTDDLDPIEALTSDDPDEAMQTGYSPPEREPHNLRDAPTPFEESQGPSLDERLSEEVPDVTEDDIFGADAEARAGRLVAPDEGAHSDLEVDEIATDVGPAGYAASAEEAAVHIDEEP